MPSGWTAETVDLTRGQGELTDQVWDLGSLHGALSIYALNEAEILSGPNGLRLLAVRQPGNREQLLVGALRPATIPRDILDTHGDRAVPWAIAVNPEPARAAAEIRQRFLPRYHQALWQVRVRALTAAANGIEEALAAWDAVSESLCDEQGWPLDDAAYSAGKITRDARAWEHVETFLALGPDVLADVRSLLVDDDRVAGPFSEDLRRMAGIDTTLARTAAIREEWEQVTALMEGIMPGLTVADAAEIAAARNEDGWAYAHELTRNGRALASAAAKLSERVKTQGSPRSQRTQAALLRSAKAPAAPAPGTTPSSASPSRAARRSR
ncbi:hypothetical protein [Streptacidiphilus anmyonensis]|uniref:hypothetical protein n=1 Tax=Streptacidiphilus anmyonensis TaxID=405782 RepID=UPI0006941D4E|nr:hypothetical protein [Streptacidiphilus anmyonensis]